jgi:hypothetical protein
MADKKVTALTDHAATLASEDLFMVIDDPSNTPANKKVSVKNVFGNVNHSTVAADSTSLSLTRSVVTVTDGQASSGNLIAGEFTVNHAGATGTTAVGNIWGSKSTVKMSSANNNVTTATSAIYGIMDIAASADSLGTEGGYGLSLDFDTTAGARGVAPSAYISFGDRFATGTLPATYLFDVFPAETRNGSLTFSTPADFGCYNDASTASTVGGTLKIRVNGEVQYIQTYTATS